MWYEVLTWNGTELGQDNLIIPDMEGNVALENMEPVPSREYPSG